VYTEQTRSPGEVAAGGAISPADLLSVEFERTGGATAKLPGWYEFSF
jgi:hypothetical protein